MPKVTVEDSKCTGCGTCVDVCPVAVFKMESRSEKSVSNPGNGEACIACRACEVQCESQCIAVFD